MNDKRISLSYILNVVAVGIVLILMLWLITNLFIAGLYPLASAVSAVTVFVALVYLRPRFSPLRWMGVGIALAIVFTLYPIFYTFYLSVTNMGSGHLMTRQQAISRLEEQLYLPEGGKAYRWTAFRSSDGDYALWVVPEEGGDGLLAKPGQPLQALTPGQNSIGALDEFGVPTTIEGYERLQRAQTVAIINDLGEIEFGAAPEVVRITSLSEAHALVPQYRYDAAQDAIVSQKTGELFKPVEGTFTSPSGEELTPGYIVFVGTRQFEAFLGNEGFRRPLLRIFIWDVVFAFMSVFLSFVVGLIVTLMFEDLPGKQIIRALLIIPWPIPVLVSVLIWRYMLHPDMGFVAPFFNSLFGSSPQWFQDPFWTRVALVLVNVWLSYPYFYVITAGALGSISEEIFDASRVDGAGPWSRFYYISLPLLLRILTPLLIASFTFNFNNFNVIYIFNFGNPPMAGTIIPMGHTDILISLVYQLAFTASNVANYGLAAAITIVLFVFIALMVLVQVRLTSLFKEAV
jgi:arabinogalactan oligomer / maltooligosaccharide transport system permease protein